DLVPAPRVHEVEVHPAFSDAGEMPVPFDEPGNGEPPAEIENLCRWPDVRRDVGVRSDGHDAAVTRSQGLRSGTANVDGDDVTVAKNEVGGRHGRRRLRGAVGDQ